MDEKLKELQFLLISGGLYSGKADGLYGPLTEIALNKLISNRGFVDRASYPWVEEFRKVFGLHEIRDNEALKAWLISDGKTLGDPKMLPWCGDAMATAIRKSLPDEKFVGVLAENPYWALNWAAFGDAIEPCFGAIGVFKRAEGGHVGVLVSQSKDTYHVLGGNQGDSVSLTSVPKSSFVTSRWPKTFERPLIRALHFASSPNQASLA